MEPAMVMSRNQIEDRRKKAEQKRKEKATQREVKRSKRLTKYRNEGTDIVENHVASTNVPNVSMNVFSNDLNLVDYLLPDQNHSSTELPYVTLDTSDSQYLDNLVNQPWDIFETTSETNNLPSTTLTESTSTDQDGLIELIESLLH